MLLLIAALGCNGETDPVAWSGPYPFPNAAWVEDGQLAIPDDVLPVPDGGTPVPVERLTWRSGFSPVQTTLFQFDVALDPTSLDGVDAVGTAGAVQIWDLDDGVRLASFSEVDAWPDNAEIPLLIARPLEAMTAGHEVAVVVTDQVRDVDGGTPEAPEWWTAALAGEAVDGIDAEDAVRVDARLRELGVEPLVATWFPIAEDAGRPLTSLVGEVSVPTEWSWKRNLDDADGDEMPEQAWRILEGSFTSDTWLLDDDRFVLDDGVPQPQGSADVHVYVLIPDSLKDTPLGEAPVWVFGHGIFSQPSDYLNSLDDDNGMVDMADRAGAVLIGTKWRGLTRTDLVTAVSVGNDFGTIPSLTDKLVQGVLDNVALTRLIAEGGLLDNPELEGVAAPQVPMYQGISLGGIQGATLLAVDPTIQHGVFHVGGGSWSTMLERSSNWSQFEIFVEDGVASAADRQLLYAVSQLFWDGADPMTHADGLVGRSVLWQESIGDEQVPNLTTESLARSVGVSLLEPSYAEVWGLDAGSAAPALAQFDPETARPADENRPAAVSGAHGAPRHWDGVKEQTIRFLDPDDPGVVEHFCGDAVCSASNSGE